MRVNLKDSIISLLAYVTFGFASLIWIIYANVTKKRISEYLQFNLYQAIFISILMAVVSLLYNIIIDFLSFIPFIRTVAKVFNEFFNLTPMFFGYSLSALLSLALIIYLCAFVVVNKKPYLPIISDIISANVRG